MATKLPMLRLTSPGRPERTGDGAEFSTNASVRNAGEDAIAVAAGETILQAALRSGIDFPHSCRVGGCGACKCRLASGQVEELTESGYLLTADELAAGTILACQSRPRGDVTVVLPVPLARPRPATVVASRPRTEDITEITLEVAGDGIDYVAGQYAPLTLEGVATRNYSFASRPSAPIEGRQKLRFLIRHVAGGRFSSAVAGGIVGASVSVGAPRGDFRLRPAGGEATPLVFVAGGSGLAPIVAMLEEAVAQGEHADRPVTVLFGTRTEADRFVDDELSAIAAAWTRAPFRVEVVVGRPVTEALPETFAPGTEAYLCGPPAMVDRAQELLDQRGLPRARIFADRFVTAGAGASETASPVAGFLDYAKFFLFHAVGLVAIAALLAGGPATALGLAAILAFYIVGDAVSGDDTGTPRYTRPGILTVQLWLALPLLATAVFSAVWRVSPGDPLGFGHSLTRLVGYDFLAARAASGSGSIFAAFVLTGLMIGMVGTIPAHELTHRTWDKVSLTIGRWLLAFSFDTSFAIEHVYGHHRYVSTTHDPATAPRGRNVYVHVVASTIKGNISAWNIENERLQKRKMSPFSWKNAFLRGHAMSLLFVGIAFAMGGLRGAGFFIACGLWGKALLEIVNYMEHYGMVRNPETPVAPRHSWNTNRRLSSWTLFNLTRHSHHHAQGEVPYHELRPFPEAPQMIGGYLTTLVVAMIPPLWHHWMTPKVLAWDAHYATEEERLLARAASEKSGKKRFVAATPSPANSPAVANAP